MVVTQTQLITFDSITTLGVNATNAVDRTQPLTFIQWLPYNKSIYTTPENALNLYQIYVSSWYAVQGVSVAQTASSIQNLYVNLINEILINYSTVEEQRYLTNLDVTNPRDLAIAVPFFSKKIKDVCLYYVNLRETAQTATTQYNLKGSNIGVKTLLYNTISNALQSQDLTSTIATLNLSISSIRNNIVLDIEDIYDLTPDYFDTNPTLPTSAYDVSGDLRQTFFAANQNNIDPYLTLDFSQSIVNAILQYPIYTAQLGLQLAIAPAVQPNQLGLLKDSDYINNVNTGNSRDLTLNTEITNQEKYIGADFYYVITDSTLTTFTSGQLFAANSEFANVLNKRYPTIASVPSQEFLNTGKEMGLFFKPDKIGLLHFTNFNFSASVNLNNLKPNTVYYFPDPAKYGNVTSNTQQNFITPLSFFEKNYFNKVDFSNQYRFGDVDSNPYYQLFRSYQSREQTLDQSNFGISRYTDYQDFFTGGLDSIWNNIDVYPLTPVGQYPVDQRANSLITINNSLVQFKSDIYGNQYGLYKNLNTYKTPLSSPVIPNSSITDLVLDNNQFVYTTALDPTNILSAGSFNNNSSQATIVIQSYGFRFEAFSPSYVSSNFIVNTLECQTFISPTSAYWSDSPLSNSTSYVANNAYYYNTLVECGTDLNGNPAIAGNIASFLGQPTNLPLYDGYHFVVDYYDNNLNIITNYDPTTPVQYNYDYIEQNTFVSTVPAVSSTLDFSLLPSLSNTPITSLYNQRNNTTGYLYCRAPDSVNTNTINNSPLSAILTKYQSISTFDAANTQSNITLYNEIVTNGILNFDVYYDVIQIETANNLIFDKIRFNYTNNQCSSNSVTYSYLYRGYNQQFEKFSNVWFNETKNQLIVCQTKLYNQLSATNYKIVYPKIYIVDLNFPQPLQVYPTTADQNIALSSVIQYSLSSTNISIDIVEVEKPILSYNSSTDVYDLTYLCKDTAKAFYTVNVKFRYINGILKIISSTLYKPSSSTLHQNFGTYNTTSTFILPSLSTYDVLGNSYGNGFKSSIGFVNTGDSTFTFNIINYVNEFLIDQTAIYLITQEAGGFIVVP